MFQQPKGVHSALKRLSDGSERRYYYAWKGGPRIFSAWGTPAFLAEYRAHIAARDDAERRDNLSAVLDDYRQSPAFTALAAESRRMYDRCLKEIDLEFGAAPIALFEAKGARKDMLEWRDRLAVRGARTADMHIAVLKRVLSWAVDREIIDINKLARAGRLDNNTRRDRIWSEEECARFIRTQSPEMVRSLLLAIWTGQRQGDLLTMTWQAYDGSTLTTRQGKTSAHVRLRVSPELKQMLDTMPRPAETILTNSRGKPWTPGGFRASWATAMERAGLKDSGLKFHDLRGTFVTRAYRLGYNFNEIAEASGHSQRDAEAIIRRHYLAAQDMTSNRLQTVKPDALH